MNGRRKWLSLQLTMVCVAACAGGVPSVQEDAGGGDAAVDAGPADFDAGPVPGRDGGGPGASDGGPDAQQAPTPCSDPSRSPPPSWQLETHPIAGRPDLEVTTWAGAFGRAFPGGDAFNLRIRPERYVALRLDTAEGGRFGLIDFADLTGNIVGVRTRPALVSLSPCPGDFSPPDDDAEGRCRLAGVGGVNPSFSWTRDPDDVVRCTIPENDVYYLNIVYVSSETEDAGRPSNLRWECSRESPSLPCGHRLQSVVVESE